MKRGREFLEYLYLTRQKKGQVTVFIIIGVILVAIALLIYFLYPGAKTTTQSNLNPNQFIQNCVSQDLEDIVYELSVHGGSVSPEHYILYQGEEVEYLCYTNEFYKTCSVQQPLLKQHIEREINTEIKNSAAKCFNDLKESYEKDNYQVTLKMGNINTELLPKRIALNFNNSLTISKGSSQTYKEFNVVLNNNLYELIAIANSIINWESEYGDSETTLYMDYYKDLKVEKKTQSDGSKIYILTDRNTEKYFQFASRSVALPPGYGI